MRCCACSPEQRLDKLENDSQEFCCECTMEPCFYFFQGIGFVHCWFWDTCAVHFNVVACVSRGHQEASPEIAWAATPGGDSRIFSKHLRRLNLCAPGECASEGNGLPEWLPSSFDGGCLRPGGQRGRGHRGPQREPPGPERRVRPGVASLSVAPNK